MTQCEGFFSTHESKTALISFHLRRWNVQTGPIAPVSPANQTRSRPYLLQRASDRQTPTFTLLCSSVSIHYNFVVLRSDSNMSNDAPLWTPPPSAGNARTCTGSCVSSVMQPATMTSAATRRFLGPQSPEVLVTGMGIPYRSWKQWCEHTASGNRDTAMQSLCPSPR